MATHSSILAWRTPGVGNPGGQPSMGSHRVGHDWSDLAAAGMDPSLPPRQSPVSTDRRFPWITASLCLGGGFPPKEADNLPEVGDYKELSKHFMQQLAPVVFTPWESLAYTVLSCNFSVPLGKRATSDRGSTVLQARPFTYLSENVFIYETLHLISFCLVVPSYICSQR